ncbi:neuronal acetylcholine receptor subunit alpha-7-like [Oratosquilla oratoria]|uniref:neuronal acetylcholine receptor subunit alpha-7-like n=1 Tax=Oratosquilla oratoria TaxID=337810 RepID=UPI003F769005
MSKMAGSGVHLLTSVVWLLLYFTVSANAGDAEEGPDWWDLGQRIKNKILKNYDKTAMPHRDHNGTTTVYYSLSPIGIWMNDDTQIMTMNTFVYMFWKDERLSWEPEDFGGMKYVFFSPDQIWRPDITLYNNAKVKETHHYGNQPVMAFRNGYLYWVPSAELNVECPQDLTYWPYDRQVCILFLGSWSRHGWQLNPESWNGRNKTAVNLKWYMKTSHHWRVEAATIERVVMKYDCCPEPYVTLDVEITLARDSPSFVFIVILPGLGIALLTLVHFVLPFDSKQKLLMGSLASVLCSVYVIYLGNMVTHQSGSSPIIIKFFGQTLIMAFLSVILACVVCRISSGLKMSTTPPPPKLTLLLTGPLARVLLLTDMASKVGTNFGLEGNNEHVMDVASKKPRYEAEWQLLAASLDRVICYAFVLILVISALVYVLPLA